MKQRRCSSISGKQAEASAEVGGSDISTIISLSRRVKSSIDGQCHSTISARPCGVSRRAMTVGE
jgi:hypothetical protein